MSDIFTRTRVALSTCHYVLYSVTRSGVFTYTKQTEGYTFPRLNVIWFAFFSTRFILTHGCHPLQNFSVSRPDAVHTAQKEAPCWCTFICCYQFMIQSTQKQEIYNYIAITFRIAHHFKYSLCIKQQKYHYSTFMFDIAHHFLRYVCCMWHFVVASAPSSSYYLFYFIITTVFLEWE
jgi:hypothetical protein